MSQHDFISMMLDDYYLNTLYVGCLEFYGGQCILLSTVLNEVLLFPSVTVADIDPNLKNKNCSLLSCSL